jgi:hypothetical protein
MYLIATDEAGYGPKLGPLVIVGTVWKLPTTRPDPKPVSPKASQAPFDTLAAPCQIGDWLLAVDDSKKVFRQAAGLEALHAIVSAGLLWCGATQRAFPDVMAYLCPGDLPAISRTPWLALKESVPLAPSTVTAALIDHWSRSGIRLVDIKARVIPARNFNESCQNGLNKADLLSDSTLGLVRSLVESLPEASPPVPAVSPLVSTPGPDVTVHCDRHGGRRYYTGPLLHHFPESMLRVRDESKLQSAYRLDLDGLQMDVHFTVKGDQYAPVAFSSLVAKYLRELFMDSINAFFADRCQESDLPKRTAGYPVDADRFLRDVATIRRRERIDDFDLVRMR